ncbi:hypothetical protein RND81_10G110500 [Saponaria officinalis]|uniref:Endoglucanase n=1 Tax=Saponaria officinalis TaxID=3572 RepID=A0AAW1I139_SAPOF
MAFTITTLSWGATSYARQLKAARELEHVRDAIRWGTDYFLKASSEPNTLYVQVGDPLLDHQCWVRPENMRTPRTVYKIDNNTPGTEIAAETAAALAASSIVFRRVDRPYSRTLLKRARSLFKFADTRRGTFRGTCPFYCSYSGFNDELPWAATWLYMATKNDFYLDYIVKESADALVSEFNWDLKYAGSHILLAKMFLRGQTKLEKYKKIADTYICAVMPESPHVQVRFTPGGMLYMRDGANTQYVTAAAFAFSVYGDLLDRYDKQVICGDKQFSPDDLLSFAKKQMDYILGTNPQQRSYMVGFGKNPPKQAHHRGASVPILAESQVVSCPLSFTEWFITNAPNPHELTGAIVGGPDRNDHFEDKRYLGNFEEPCTYINSLAIGALARLADES